MTTELDGRITPVELETPGFWIQAPGIRATVIEHSQQSGTRAAAPQENALRAALRTAKVTMLREYQIQLIDDTLPISDIATRADGLSATTRLGEPAMVFSIPDGGPERGNIVLYRDEYDVEHWILPQPKLTTRATTREDSGSQAFFLPRPRRLPLTITPPTGDSMRGLFAIVGRPIIRVLAFSLRDITGLPALTIMTKWEEANRKYGFHLVDPAKYKQKKPKPTPIEWGMLNNKRALLLVHGTFSTSEGSYAALSRQTLDTLSQQYEGRIFAFNHPSLRHAPIDNIAEFYSLLPDGIHLDVDIVGHSRGCLVVRELLRQLGAQNEADRLVKVGKALLVAGSNEGTPFVRAENMIEALDRYTGLLVALPDNTYTVFMEALLMVAKLLATGSVHLLPGLASMIPGCDYLNNLNAATRPAVEVYGMAANFTPTDPNLASRLAQSALKGLIDNYMHEANDRVVPVSSSLAPIPSDQKFRKVYEAADGIHHNNYFSKPEPQAQLLEWLLKGAQT